MYVLDHAALTHRGTVRELNEDSVLAEPPVFVVADGIGGHQAGEVASALVTAAFATLVRSGAPIDADAVTDTLQAAHRQIRALHPDAADGVHAGTTACGAVVVAGPSDDEPYWLCFNVGDSRLYRRAPWGTELTQISVDHSHVQELVDAGVITDAEAVQHPSRNLVTRAVGTQDEVHPDYWMRPLVVGERLLICSDGLLGGGLTPELQEIACRVHPAAIAAERLLDLSLERGAKDNVSVIIVDVLERGRPADPQGAP